MKPLVDADILRYEIGFGAATGWQSDGEPSWDYVEELLTLRLDSICNTVIATQKPLLFLTEGPTFRYDIAKRKPYKGTRKENKPWHFDNLTVYMRDVLGAEVVRDIEADDAMTICHLGSDDTVLCSRDKDLRQVPGWFYSWELGRQPSFGPVLIKQEGSLELSEDNKKLKGTGLPFFYAQVLMGDASDNIPGLPGCGPKRTYDILQDAIDYNDPFDMLDTVKDAYQEYYRTDWEEELTEQGQLTWMTRRLNPDGTPLLWQIGMED